MRFRLLFFLPLFFLFQNNLSASSIAGFETNYSSDVIEAGSLQDTVPGLSKMEKRQLKAKKKLEKKVKKEKLRVAREKAKEIAKKMYEKSNTSSQKPDKPNKTNVNSGVSQNKSKPSRSSEPDGAKNPAKQNKAKADKKEKTNSDIAQSKVKAPKEAKKKKDNKGLHTTANKSSKKEKQGKDSKMANNPPAKSQISGGQLSEREILEQSLAKPVTPASTAGKTEKKSSGPYIPGPDCSFALNEKDPITGHLKRTLTSRYFFGYTEKEIREFMKGEEYLKCSGFISEVTGIKTLHLTFVIDSPTAKQEYGSIQAGSQLIIRLLDGETITLLSEKYDNGSVSKSSGKTTYQTIYIISPKDEKSLQRTEIDMVRMVWGSGYEDYEVYELDFIRDQLHCLETIK